jgi:hypothetical protein
MNGIISRVILVSALLCLVHVTVFSCTIVSAIARNGHVWNANNEDGPFGTANFINVFPKSENTKYGYYTLSYFSPALGQGGSIQGGANEAGLTFDFNAIEWVKNFDPKSKKAFPQGDDAILSHILSNMNSVQQVIDFFNTYWFQNGFRGAQMHVADRNGRFAIISASGIQLTEKGQPLVSTNFDICGKEVSSSCWRYPIATSKLSTNEVGLMTMMSIALETAQKNGSTMYTNIQNLTTGDIWFFSQHSPNVIVNTNIKDMLAKGQKSYTFSDLKSIIEDRPKYSWSKPQLTQVSDESKSKYVGKYDNSFTGNILAEKHKDGLQVSFGDGSTEVFHPQSENRYFLPNGDVYIEFKFDEIANRMALSLYENGFWSFRAWLVK